MRRSDLKTQELLEIERAYGDRLSQYQNRPFDFDLDKIEAEKAKKYAKDARAKLFYHYQTRDMMELKVSHVFKSSMRDGIWK
jgi:hypothetical protein